ncbi:MAG: MFS transporter [Pseudomonadota bacterium]
MEPERKTDLKNSVYDGMFAHMFATLTGGVFLTGFALYLGMTDLMIGLLAAMPFVVTLFQLPTSYFIVKNPERKKVAYWAAAIARLLWIPVVIFALLLLSPGVTRYVIVLGLIFISYAFISISYVSWFSWTSDLVPDEIRGRFFGTRNMFCGAAGMVVMVLFGKLLDRLNGQPYGGLPLGFAITFMSAVFFGMVSLRFLNLISEPPVHEPSRYASFQKLTSLPFKDPNFRKFLVFSLLWSFSVYFASPFFTVYFLRELHFSYGFVATLGMLSAFADLIGMRIWGRISDRVKNKAVIQSSGWIAIFLPVAWVTVQPGSVLIPIFLHLVGGGFWAGINLCMNNLLLRISPQENRAFFLSTYNFIGGLGAATGPILAGLTLKSVSNLDLQLFSWQILPLHLVFVGSTLFRLLSFQLFRYVREPEEVTVGEMVRVLRGVRGLNVANGFNYLLHPFIETSVKGKEH